MVYDTFYELISEFNYRMMIGSESAHLRDVISVCRNEIVPTMLTDNEIQLYRFIVNQRCSYNEEYNMLEIGSHLGGSTFVFSTQLKDQGSSKKLYSIDPHYFMGVNTRSEYDLNLLKFNLTNVIPIYKLSKEQRQGFDDKLDFLFIDGNHTYPFVKEDLELWESFVVDGGFIVMHDYNDFSVYKQQDEFLHNYPKSEYYVETGLDRGTLISSIIILKRSSGEDKWN